MIAMRSTPLAALVGLVLLAQPPSAVAIVLYSSQIGWRFASSTDRIDEGFSFKGTRLEPVTTGVRGLLLSRHGALCPAAGTPDFLCAEAFSAAGDAGGRLTLHASTRLVRKAAVGLNVGAVDAVYADTTIEIYDLGVVGVAPPVANAYFVFGLSGTASQTVSDPAVVPFAFASARLDGAGVQCAGTTCEPVRRQNWTPQSLRLNLRTDVGVSAPNGMAYEAEMVADFADTFELLAIALHDENDEPIPGAAVVVTDGAGHTVFTIPSTVGTTTTTTTTADGTTSTGATSTSTSSTTTTTTRAGDCAPGATFASIGCRLDELAALASRDGGPLAPKLLARLGAARDALGDAEAGESPRTVARAFKKARKQLAGVGRLVRTRKAQRVLPEATRSTLQAAVVELGGQVRELAARWPG